jgi:hypothetical protein
MKPDNKPSREAKRLRTGKVRGGHSSLAQPAPVPREESEPNWITEQHAELVLLALFGGTPWRYTPFEEIAKDCPAVWERALEVFGGNRVTARKWLETRSPAFEGKCPYTVALQVNGEQKVLRELKRLARARAKRSRSST